ncbi:MAG: hypothetical protein WKF96_25680 [Solirubrobacteraceae bacterium]
MTANARDRIRSQHNGQINDGEFIAIADEPVDIICAEGQTLRRDAAWVRLDGDDLVTRMRYDRLRPA